MHIKGLIPGKELIKFFRGVRKGHLFIFISNEDILEIDRNLGMHQHSLEFNK
jgi:hypothetical protein